MTSSFKLKESDPESLLCYCLYCLGMQVFGSCVTNDRIIINHHHHRSCDWCDKWNSSQTKDLPEAEIKGQFCVSHAYIGRNVLTCWWTTVICIWLPNESKRHHRIYFAVNDKLARWFADGEKWPARVCSLWWQPERDGRCRSQMCGNNTCVRVWRRSAGCLSTCVAIHCRGLPVGWRTNKPVGKKKSTPRRDAEHV